MKRHILTALALAVVPSWAAEKLSVEVGYGFVGTSSSGFYTASPDTSFVTIKNTGDNRFAGSLSLTGLSGFGVFGHIDVDDHTPLGFSLAPGESWTLFGGPEASNYGGYNKCQEFIDGDPSSGQDPTQGADSGLLLHIVGSLGTAGDIDYSIYDYEIHSGSSRANPFGTVVDNYILQGGDPFGRDTGDDFEESQVHALFDVIGSRTAEPLPCPTPDAGSSALLVSGGLMVLGAIRRKV